MKFKLKQIGTLILLTLLLIPLTITLDLYMIVFIHNYIDLELWFNKVDSWFNIKIEIEDLKNKE